MALFSEIAKVVAASAILLTTASSVATSQEQADVAASQNVITESFEGNDPSLMLGGQIDLRGTITPWVTYIADGELVIENTQDPNSLYYNDISTVKFPDSHILEPTAGLVISVTVDGTNMGSAGAGILIGSGKAGSYLMFSVDGQGRYHLLRKDGRKLRREHSAAHAAIVEGAPNRLAFEYRGANVAFLVNETEVVQIPLANGAPNSRLKQGAAGIGLAAFGIGTFNFDDIEIAKVR
ncbi:MAG: hypothetical protein P1U83_07020 [Roseovarius sp.]|nr:hypothetical protein [Roseovarius sp.]